MADIHIKTNWTLNLNTYIALAGATVSVLYRDPNGNEGTFSGATITESTKVQKSFVPADLTASGRWGFQAKAVFGSVEYHGDIYYTEIKEILE